MRHGSGVLPDPARPRFGAVDVVGGSPRSARSRPRLFYGACLTPNRRMVGDWHHVNVAGSSRAVIKRDLPILGELVNPLVRDPEELGSVPHAQTKILS